MMTALGYVLTHYSESYKAYLEQHQYDENEHTALTFVESLEGELEDSELWHN